MADSIEIQLLDNIKFRVVVKSEGGSHTEHIVSLSDDYWEQLCKKKVPKDMCIRLAFEFLLKREPKESILSGFDLPTISSYFPEFEEEFRKQAGI